ncbi:response regulator NasT [Yoonia maritima]|uniref:Response regulator NasT n=1 Tax=Yoonia maritima TaxID=1435347 RepID=A0A2T0W3B4_9RHOB|nr:ANTAR domain-containing protein [Yoonia maritima]PRY79636.1 response regulator NasT [Yoonia maritima]
MDVALKILVVEPDAARAQDIIDALKDGGWGNVFIVSDISSLAPKLTEIDPDIVLIDIAHPDRDTLEHIGTISHAKARPVAMFVDRSDADLTQAAITAGLSAYVVDGLQKNRIKPVLETAIARFKMIEQMRRELDAAKQALTDRKTIDRAKGLLMNARNINEEDAYSLLRKTAMDQGRKVIDVAHALVTAADLLG